MLVPRAEHHGRVEDGVGREIVLVEDACPVFTDLGLGGVVVLPVCV